MQKNNQENIEIEPTLNIKDLIAPAGLKIESNYFQLEKKFGRTLFVLTYPRFLETAWLSPVITLDREMNISLFVHPQDSAVILKQLNKKTTQISAQISEKQEKGYIRDPILETALQDTEDLRDKLTQGRERLFKFGLYITIFGETLQELEQIENEVRSLLETRMIYIKPALFQQEQGLISSLPLNKDALQIQTPLNSSPLSSLFPFVSMDLSDNKGALYGINRHNNSLILFDRFGLENANTVVFGKSGGGKSYAIKLEVLRSLILGAEVIIIDPEKEYKYLAEATGGAFLDISLTSPYHINPFDLPLPSEDEKPQDILRTNIIELVGLLRIMLGGLSPEEDALLDKALNQTYLVKNITGESDFSKISPPLMKDLYLVLKNMENGEGLAVRLERFVSGSYAGFFNSPSNIDLNKKVLVFSLRDMQEEIRPMAMYLVLHFIWSKIRANIRKRILVVDEAWWMLQHPDAASFLLSIAKRARKYWLGLTTITQDVSDFISSPFGKPIIANSSLQLLLKQSPSTIDSVMQTFHLTQEEKYLLLECAVGEGLFFAGLKHVAIKIVASYTEDQIITSDPAQLLEIEKAKQEIIS